MTMAHQPINQELKTLLEKHAINNEVMVAVSNKNLIHGMLATFVEQLKIANVRNLGTSSADAVVL